MKMPPLRPLPPVPNFASPKTSVLIPENISFLNRFSKDSKSFVLINSTSRNSILVTATSPAAGYGEENPRKPGWGLKLRDLSRRSLFPAGSGREAGGMGAAGSWRPSAPHQEDARWCPSAAFLSISSNPAWARLTLALNSFIKANWLQFEGSPGAGLHS